MLLASFWFSFVVDVCKHTIALFAGHHQDFVARTGITQAYMGSSPVTTDDSSCFDASRFSISTKTADFP